MMGSLGLLLAAGVSGIQTTEVSPTRVFSVGEVAKCGEIRTPQPAMLANGTIVLFAQCRVVLMAEDDFRHTRMVTKTSHDGGETWSPMSFVTEESTGVGVAVVDKARDALVFQYQTLPNKDPYEGNTLWQKVSTDAGATWSTPVNLTSQIANCNSNATLGMVCGAAGSRIQTTSGRLVFSGHNRGSICVWFSDDGGETYSTSELFKGNEQSIAQLADGSLYMNGRGTQWPWKNRTAYRSKDGGATWSEGEPTPLTDVNCEAPVITANNGSTLFFSEPIGPGRYTYTLHCSCNGGVTWPSSLTVNKGQAAQYSSLVDLGGGKLLAVWEQLPTQLSHVFDTEWCECQA
eukprot:Hpha_TRINITY_DN35252_c0_g1::TRINITY_DN35252_c0_g1_i1::g.145188::m.145188/K01186/NEU1; sialidase-1